MKKMFTALCIFLFIFVSLQTVIAVDVSIVPYAGAYGVNMASNKYRGNENTFDPDDPDAEEKRLGRALTEIRRNLIKPYIQLKTGEEKLEFLEKHPEIEEVIEIISWIDTNKEKVR